MMRLRKAIGPTQPGFSLIEMLIALGILSLIIVAFMVGLGTALRAQGINKEKVIAENLAGAQLEEIRRQPFLDNYNTGCSPACVPPSGITVPPGYLITVDTQAYCIPWPSCTPPDNNIQITTVSVSHGGKPLLMLEDLKSRR